MEPLMTTEEVAAYLQVEVVTVRRLVMRGELPAYRIGSEFRFIASEVGDFVKSQRVTAHDALASFSKFTQRSLHVLKFAQEEAAALGHGFIGTEHLLLGILHDSENVAAKALVRSGLDLATVRERVMHVIQQTSQDHVERPPAQITAALRNALGMDRSIGERGLTKRAKKVIELSVDEARRQGHHSIGTEHLLLGILREGEGLAALALIRDCGVQLDAMREIVTQILQDHAATTQALASEVNE